MRGYAVVCGCAGSIDDLVGWFVQAIGTCLRVRSLAVWVCVSVRGLQENCRRILILGRQLGQCRHLKVVRCSSLQSVHPELVMIDERMFCDRHMWISDMLFVEKRFMATLCSRSDSLLPYHRYSTVWCPQPWTWRWGSTRHPKAQAQSLQISTRDTLSLSASATERTCLMSCAASCHVVCVAIVARSVASVHVMFAAADCWPNPCRRSKIHSRGARHMVSATDTHL